MIIPDPSKHPDTGVAAIVYTEQRSLDDQRALRALFVVMRRRFGEQELESAMEEVTEIVPEWEELIARSRRPSKDTGIQGS